MSGVALLPAGANVVLQLSQLPVGHAVATSQVFSGSLALHPIKRTRTTLAFLGIAVFGTDEERRDLRAQIDAVHARVHSGPEDPVAYDALDPSLQGWVAACLYQGARQAVELTGLELTEFDEELYRLAERLGTTLQVPAGWWPPDRAAFDAYWSDGLEHARFDPLTRDYLVSFVGLGFLPWRLGVLLGPLHRLIVGVFLPAPLREGLGLNWSARRERLARAIVRGVASGWGALPRALRHFPLNWVLHDTRRRLALGRPVI